MYKQQHTDHFIGRTQEIETFTAWLIDPNSPWILYIHDAVEEADKKGGVGKTWLLRRCAEMTRQDHPDIAIVMVDFFNAADRDCVFLAEKIIASLQELYPAWSPAAFTEAVKLYRREERRSADSGGIESDDMRIRELVSASLAEDLRQLNLHLEQEKKTLLIFFDTFEVIEPTPTIAILRQSQTFPDNYQLERIKTVIAGRNQLDWTHPNWRDREQEVQILSLTPFSPQEMQEYVKTELIYDLLPESEQAQALYERTEGRPIVIGLAIDVLNHRILTIENLVAIAKSRFEASLVPQINKLENPMNWAILFMAHIYHRFNMSILERILQEVELDGPVNAKINRADLSSRLPRLTFVRQAGSIDNFVLHDEMRRLVTKYCWEIQDPRKSIRKAVSKCVISYYEQEVLKAPNDQQRQTLIIEMLYHHLFVDLEDGITYFQLRFYEALRLQKRAFARLLFQETQKFIGLMSPVQLNELQLDEAGLLRTEENASAALDILHQLKDTGDPAWYEENEPRLLMEEGRCYKQQSKWLEASDSFTQCLAIQQTRGNELQCAHLLNNLGLISRLRGQFAQSLHSYEESITLYKKLGRQSEYATTLNGTSTVYRLQGKVEEALRRCKIAWRIRRDLFREDKVSEVQIGSSLNTLGRIYISAGNIIEAERCFNDAFDIYLRTNNKGGIATIYNRFGLIQLMKGNLDSAKEWFAKAERASQEIDGEQYITSLNKQGNICALQHRWDAATTFFERAISHARQASDYYQQTESLIDLADALEHLEQRKRIQDILQEAEETATRENYFYLLGRVEHLRGEIDYRAKDYSVAFTHFAMYCHHMALYNDSEFKTAVNKSVDALLGISKHEVLLIAQELLAYWTTHQLETQYPDFVQAFEEIDDLMEV